jgi:hypothetical protein
LPPADYIEVKVSSELLIVCYLCGTSQALTTLIVCRAPKGA